MTKTQKVGVGVAISGGAAVLAGIAISAYLGVQNAKVGASPSDFVMQILTLLFGGGVPLTIGGILTAIISWFTNRKTVVPINQTVPTDGDSSELISGVTTPELVELTAAFLTFLRNREDKPTQRRLIVALVGVADIVPNFKAAIELDELVFRAKLGVLASVSIPLAVKSEGGFKS